MMVLKSDGFEYSKGKEWERGGEGGEGKRVRGLEGLLTSNFRATLLGTLSRYNELQLVFCIL